MGTNKPSEEQTWEEAGYSNNYVFKMTMDDEDLCKELLECLLNLKISKIVIKQHEKEIETSKESHGVRLDIHIVDFDGIIYDIEMQTGEYSADYFAKRARYYQSMLDQDVLKKGNSYTKLKRTIVIFI
ncbi:MAG: Rpn family recombination-promoting nuclease/putative transposase, partial [Selenomonadales bacterium]|nr:Rpn family recombination-promoting nuclease/putative transposase [Selenomonadales bacterium]